MPHSDPLSSHHQKNIANHSQLRLVHSVMNGIVHGRDRRQAGGRWQRIVALCARIAAASVGGYGLAAASAAFLARALPMSRVEAATAATLIAFLAMPAAAVWAFAASTAPRALGGVVMTTVVLGAAAWLLGPRP